MVDLNLPEPPIEQRSCDFCGKRKSLTGRLIHWPSATATEPRYPVGWLWQEPFSFWSYKCRWCKAIRTKRRQSVVIPCKESDY